MVTENVGVPLLASEFGLCNFIYSTLFIDQLSAPSFCARTLTDCLRLTSVFHSHIQYCTPLVDPSFSFVGRELGSCGKNDGMSGPGTSS